MYTKPPTDEVGDRSSIALQLNKLVNVPGQKRPDPDLGQLTWGVLHRFASRRRQHGAYLDSSLSNRERAPTTFTLG